MSKADTKTRFMAKVNKKEDGCWNWIGSTDRKGYGKLSIGNGRKPDGTRGNSMVSAHRVAYELFIGPIPAAAGFHGTCVLHKCDNPSCVNPEHLFLGSNADNVHDMDAKGRRVNRQALGSAHGNAKLTEAKVIAIHQLIKSNTKTQTEIALEFGVCLATVNHIAKGRLWSHVTGVKKVVKV